MARPAEQQLRLGRLGLRRRERWVSLVGRPRRRDLAAAGQSRSRRPRFGAAVLLLGADPPDLRGWLSPARGPLAVARYHRSGGACRLHAAGRGGAMGFRRARRPPPPAFPGAPRAWP